MQEKLRWPKPGKYILAVSGGVDSVVLLDLLSNKYQLIVAHLNHSVRPDSNNDEKFVAGLAQKYNCAYESKTMQFDNFSEEKGREARYQFFSQLMEKHQADGIITAHHRDDVLETALINLSRGTKHRGLVALGDSQILRPLLDVPKSDIYKYAKTHKLKWHEDSTNQDPKYKRNWFRGMLGKKDHLKQQLAEVIDNESELLEKIDSTIDQIKHKIIAADNHLNRYQFIMLPHSLSKEMVAIWLKDHQLNSKTIELIVRFIKVAKRGEEYSLSKDFYLKIELDTVLLLRKH